MKGEFIADPYAIALSPLIPPGVYWMEVGLYHPQTGERLMTEDAQGHIRLLQVRVD